MLFSVTDPKSYITEYTLVYEENSVKEGDPPRTDPGAERASLLL